MTVQVQTETTESVQEQPAKKQRKPRADKGKVRGQYKPRVKG
jgi:hypothetical protein